MKRSTFGVGNKEWALDSQKNLTYIGESVWTQIYGLGIINQWATNVENPQTGKKCM